MSKSKIASSIAPEYPILGLLSQCPSHGYALDAALERELGQIWTISQSQTYNILNRLEAQGLIHGVEQKRESGPDRYLLHITAAGRAHFERWLTSPSGTSAMALRVEFLTRLYFARQTAPDMVASLIQDQIDEISAGIKQLEDRQGKLADTSQINQWALEVRINQLQGFLQWLKAKEQELARTQ